MSSSLSGSRSVSARPCARLGEAAHPATTVEQQWTCAIDSNDTCRGGKLAPTHAPRLARQLAPQRSAYSSYGGRLLRSCRRPNFSVISARSPLPLITFHAAHAAPRTSGLTSGRSNTGKSRTRIWWLPGCVFRARPSLAPAKSRSVWSAYANPNVVASSKTSFLPASPQSSRHRPTRVRQRQRPPRSSLAYSGMQLRGRRSLGSSCRPPFMSLQLANVVVRAAPLAHQPEERRPASPWISAAVPPTTRRPLALAFGGLLT